MDSRLQEAARSAITSIKELLRHGSENTGREEMTEVGVQIGMAIKDVLPEPVQDAIRNTLAPEGALGPEEEATTREIFTDGSCLDNPGGPGGWAFVEAGNPGVERAGRVESTTNNRMELRAILEALQKFDEGEAPKIYSDSKYAIFTSSQTWDAEKNLDILEDIWDEVNRTEATFDFVPGHEGHQHNERADELARDAAKGDV